MCGPDGSSFRWLYVDSAILGVNQRRTAGRTAQALVCVGYGPPQGHSSSIEQVKWGGEGLIYTASRDRTIKVWAANDTSRVRCGRRCNADLHRLPSECSVMVYVWLVDALCGVCVCFRESLYDPLTATHTG